MSVNWGVYVKSVALDKGSAQCWNNRENVLGGQGISLQNEDGSGLGLVRSEGVRNGLFPPAPTATTEVRCSLRSTFSPPPLLSSPLSGLLSSEHRVFAHVDLKIYI